MIAINFKPPDKQLRQFAGIWFPAFWLLVGFLVGRHAGAWSIVFGAWAVLAVWSLAGVAIPRVIRPAWIGLMCITWPIGFVISHVLLGATYYLLMTPIGFLLKLLGKDPMERRRRPEASTYWETMEQSADPKSYFRQF